MASAATKRALFALIAIVLGAISLDASAATVLITGSNQGIGLECASSTWMSPIRRRASQQKKIVAISSAAGSVSVPPFMPNGSPVPDHYWYRITKAGLNSSMRLVSAQFKNDGVIVVMFHPGGVKVESFGNIKLDGFVPPAEAIGKMIKTIDGLTMKDSGRFLDNDSEDHPW